MGRKRYRDFSISLGIYVYNGIGPLLGIRCPDWVGGGFISGVDLYYKAYIGTFKSPGVVIRGSSLKSYCKFFDQSCIDSQRGPPSTPVYPSWHDLQERREREREKLTRHLVYKRSH